MGKKMKKKDFHGYTIYEDGTVMGLYGKEVKKRINKDRYEIRLSINKKRKNFIVARLLYYVFVGFDISDKDLCIVHKDGNKLNINLDNLELKHRRDLIQGEKHKSIVKLTDEQVKEIRKSYSGKAGVNQFDKIGKSLNDLAKEYGVSKENIKMIVDKKSRYKKDYKL